MSYQGKVSSTKNVRLPFNREKKTGMDRWHFRQEPALQRRDEISKASVCVFCAEMHHRPIRKFITALLDQLVEWYFALAPELRHLYEVIPYDNPCCLYFDIEYKISLNPQLSENVVMQTLKLVIMKAVAQYLGIEITEGSIVDLVATTDTKMSHHLIVHMPGLAFENNQVCGKFVKLVHEESRSYAENGTTGLIYSDGTMDQNQIGELFANSTRGKQFYVISLCIPGTGSFEF